MNKFKDKMNRWRTLSLFKETATYPQEHVLFTFEEARELFVECNDPTGYKFATTHLGGWKHFSLLRNSKALTEQVDIWEAELEIKLRSEAVGNMIDLSKGERGYQASKFLVDGGWLKKGAGRPTKAAQNKAIRQHIEEYDSLSGSVDLKH